MSLNYKMEKILRAKTNLEKKLVKEGLTKNEHSLLNEIKKTISEAPIDYEGPERMDPNIERQITRKQTPYHEHPSVPKLDRDFVELIASKRFKDSVEKVRRYLGDTGPIQGPNALMRLMSMAMQGLRQVNQVEMRNKRTLENLAVELVKRELDIKEGQLQFDVELVFGGMGAAEGMKGESEQPDEEDVKKAFENKDNLEDFVDEFERFNAEKAKRRFMNALVQGAAFKGGHMFVLAAEELNRLYPNLVELYGTNQALMEHLYWIYPDMESMAASGGGQMGQSSFDPTTKPPTIIARAGTFPLLVHEIVKGIYDLFSAQGLPDDPSQREMVVGSEDTLPGEIWDSRLGPIFWEKLLAAYPEDLFDDDKKYIQHYLFTKLSRIDAKQFLKLAQLILKDDPKGKQWIQGMVNDIVSELKRRDYEESMGSEDDDDDVDDINLDDLY